MRRFKQTWFAIWCVGRWSLGICVSARCQRYALRRRRFAQRGIDASSGAFVTPRNLAHTS